MRGLKGVRPVLCAVEFLQPPKYVRWGRGGGEETEGKAADGRESRGGEEGGETGKESIRRTGGASQSEARSGAAAAGAAEPGRAGPRSQPRALRGPAQRAQAPAKSPPCCS